MKKIFLLAFLGINLIAHSQNVIILQPGHSTGKDSEISDYASNQNTNYGNYGVIASYIWSNGTVYREKALLQFDFSSIPAGAIITGAYLDLYASPPGNTFGSVTQSMNGTNNASYLRRILEPWDENTVTWNNQPKDTNINQVILPTSTSGSQNYLNIDVTQLVNDMTLNGNYGFMIEPVSTQPNNSMLFNSSDYSDTTLSPKLTINYIISGSNCITLRPDATHGKDSEISDYPNNLDQNYGNYGTFASYVWSNGTIYREKALLQFDLSSIPTGATITDAKLDLYADNPTTTFGGGNPMNGNDNASYIRRITQPWNENTVTWNNQPRDTTFDQEILPTSDSGTQNYLDINVTKLVQDMLIYGNYGFMLEPVATQPYNSMVFRTSDYPDSAYHPELRVCYSLNTQVNNAIQPDKIDIQIYPNPFRDHFTISVGNSSESNEVEITSYNIMGQTTYKNSMQLANGSVIINRREIYNEGQGLIILSVKSKNVIKTFKLVAN
jgi:hypothetical protein